ncbi:hypothetical protein [Wolinella succinogenes]|uniref:hypothetical protein n=1 Tax=Wolinella succinogenes TaxID=844 RepID=UPI002409A473|nr:hypothetical protein [Wolinella succinogenes]
MRFISFLALFFGLAYGAIWLHYLGFDRAKKSQELEKIASKMRHIEPSLSFKGASYKEFVYDN